VCVRAHRHTHTGSRCKFHVCVCVCVYTPVVVAIFAGDDGRLKFGVAVPLCVRAFVRVSCLVRVCIRFMRIWIRFMRTYTQFVKVILPACQLRLHMVRPTGLSTRKCCPERHRTSYLQLLLSPLGARVCGPGARPDLQARPHAPGRQEIWTHTRTSKSIYA